MANPHARLLDWADIIRASHEIYMNELGFVDHPRHFRGIQPARLRVLQYLLEHDDGPTVGRIAKWLRISDSHASHILADLMQRHCVEGRVDAIDRRCRIYELTAEGRAIAISWRSHVRSALCGRIWRWPVRKQEAIAETMAEFARRLRSPEFY